MIIDVSLEQVMKWTSKAFTIHNARIEYNSHEFLYVIRLETSYDAMDHRLSLFVYIACTHDDCDFDICVHTEVEDL